MKTFSFLTNSDTRRRLLLLFFSNPEKKYYLHAIARLTEKPAQNLRRELLPLVDDELFLKEHVGNLTFYQLNKTHPLYSELKSIVSKTIGIEGLLRDGLKEVPGIEVAFIYGSYAAGEEKGSSDIDILIIGKPVKTALAQRLRKIGEAVDREINYIVYQRKSFQNMKKTHNSFIESVMRKSKIFLMGNKNDIE